MSFMSTYSLEARDAERERRPERHVRLRVKPLRVNERHADAPEHARQRADQVEVAEERGGARLLVAEAVAHLAAPAVRASRAGALPSGRDAPSGRVLEHGQARCSRAQLREKVDPLVAHRGQIAGDAAVVADELPLVGARVLEVRVVDERARDLAARRATAGS